MDFSGVLGSCYFPAAFQGEYVTQSIMSGVPTISYSSLSVLMDSIPVWGVCHRRIGNNVIMMEDTGGITCFKCFNLVLRSSNVLQVHTGGLDKCYTTEERAVADCPTDIAIREKRAREIMLYREFKRKFFCRISCEIWKHYFTLILTKFCSRIIVVPFLISFVEREGKGRRRGGKVHTVALPKY